MGFEVSTCEPSPQPGQRAGPSPQGGLVPLPPCPQGCVSLCGVAQPPAPVPWRLQLRDQAAPPHQSPAFASRVPPGRAQTHLIAPHPSVVPVPVPPHPAVREAAARQPPALLLDVRGQPGADPGRPRRGHSLSGGGCGPRPPRGTLGAPGGHHLGPGPEAWVCRVHRAHEGRLTTEVPTVPLHCPGFRIPPPRVMSFSSPPPHLGARTLTRAHASQSHTAMRSAPVSYTHTHSHPSWGTDSLAVSVLRPKS